MRASLLWTATAAVEGSNVVVMVALTKCNFLEKRFVLIFFIILMVMFIRIPELLFGVDVVILNPIAIAEPLMVSFVTPQYLSLKTKVAYN